MNSKLSGLMCKDEEYQQDMTIVGKFLKLSRQELGLEIKDVELITQVPAQWIEQAENGEDIPRFVRGILVLFFDFVVGYNYITTHKK